MTPSHREPAAASEAPGGSRPQVDNTELLPECVSEQVNQVEVSPP